jgi:hypothetical protein
VAFVGCGVCGFCGALLTPSANKQAASSKPLLVVSCTSSLHAATCTSCWMYDMHGCVHVCVCGGRVRLLPSAVVAAACLSASCLVPCSCCLCLCVCNKQYMPRGEPRRPAPPLPGRWSPPFFGYSLAGAAGHISTCAAIRRWRVCSGYACAPSSRDGNLAYKSRYLSLTCVSDLVVLI